MTKPKNPQLSATHSKVTYIYGLIDPLAGLCRYVGKADCPQLRHKRHLADQADTHKVRWIRELGRLNSAPLLVIYEIVASTRWQERERYWIARIRESGVELTNSSEGGQGTLSPSAETRMKMRAAKVGSKQSPEHRAKVSAALKGKPKPPRTPEHVEAIAKARRGVKMSPAAADAFRLVQLLTKARGASGFKGVYYDKRRKLFSAHIEVAKKFRHLGRYETAVEAACAYNRAATSFGWPPEGLNKV